MGFSDRTVHTISVRNLEGVYDKKRKVWVTSHGDFPDPQVEVQAEGLTQEDKERYLRHELMQRIVELRQENYWLKNKMRRKQYETLDDGDVLRRIERLREVLASITWAESHEQAVALASEALRA